MSRAWITRRTRRNLSVVLLSAGVVALAADTAAAAPSCTASGGIRTCTFSPAGSVQRWAVPADVDGALTVTGRGAHGFDPQLNTTVTPGGRPAEVTARFTLPSGAPLAVLVGSSSGSRAQFDRVLPPGGIVDPAALLNDSTNSSYPLLVAGGGGDGGAPGIMDNGNVVAMGGAGGDAGLPGGRAATGAVGATSSDAVSGGGGGGGAFSGVQGTGSTYQTPTTGAGGAGGGTPPDTGGVFFTDNCSTVVVGASGTDGSGPNGGTSGGGRSGEGGDGFTGGGGGGQGAKGSGCGGLGASEFAVGGDGGGGGGSSFIDFSGEPVSSGLVGGVNSSGALSVSYRILGPTASIAAGSGGGDIAVTFQSAVSGFGVGDLSARLPDGQTVRLDTISGVSIVGDQPGTSFTVRGVTSALRAAGYSQTGTHTISLADTGPAILTPDGAALRGAASFSWNVPVVSIQGAPTTPAFDGATDVRIVPSAHISGLGVEDLRLLRDDVIVPLDGVSVDFVITFTGTYYKVNGLGPLTTAPGEYTLTLDTTGVFDELGDPLVGAQRVIWQNRRLLATMQVPTTPQTTGVDTIPVLFTRAVTGLDAGDFALVQRGVSIDACGDGFCSAGAAVPITGTVTGADTTWQLAGLRDETTPEGIYTLTLNDNGSPTPLRGIEDGVFVETPTSASFVVDYGPPTVAFTPSTDPPVGPDDTVTIRFSEPVDGFDAGDVTLTRDGVPVDLAGLIGLNPIRKMVIDNTTGVLSPQGTYVLRVAAGGITDQRAGRPFAGATHTWTVNLPPTGSFGTLSPTDTGATGRSTAVTSVPVTFSEEVVGFDNTDLALTRDGQPVSLTGVTVTGSGTAYTVSGLGNATVLPGAYVLSIKAGSGIRDLSSTDLTGTPSVSWTMRDVPATVQAGNAQPVAEGNPPTGGALTFPINLDRPANGDVTVTWATTAAGTATAGVDFRSTSGTARIPSGATGTTVSVPVIPDTLDEPDETVQIRMTGVTGRAVLGTPATATGTITDDDPTPTLSVGDTRVLEGRNGFRWVQIPVTVATPGTSPVTITWGTRDGTARAGTDYRARTAQTLTIPAGATSATLSVQVQGDRTPEPDETFDVVIGQVRGGAIADGTGVVTIANDD